MWTLSTMFTYFTTILSQTHSHIAGSIHTIQTYSDSYPCKTTQNGSNWSRRLIMPCWGVELQFLTKEFPPMLIRHHWTPPKRLGSSAVSFSEGSYPVNMPDYDLEAFWLRPVMAITTNVQLGSGRIVHMEKPVMLQDYFIISFEKSKRGWTLITSQYTITWHILYILELKKQLLKIQKLHIKQTSYWKYKSYILNFLAWISQG